MIEESFVIRKLILDNSVFASVGCELLIPLLMRHLKFHLKDEETNRDKEEVKKEKIQAVEILTHILITVSNKHVSFL